MPICRVVFCDGRTRSLIPAVLWRGQGTVGFVVQAVMLVREVGLEAAWERLRAAGPWSPARSTLGRWCRRVRAGLSAGTAVLGHALDPAALAATEVLLAIRRALGRGVLDRPPGALARSPARPIPGRLAPASPPETGGPRRPRGAWSRPRPRGPPRDRREEETTED